VDPRSSLLESGPLQSFVSYASARWSVRRLTPFGIRPSNLRPSGVTPLGTRGSASPEVSCPLTQLRRVPLLQHGLPRGRPCGTRIARPSSVPSSGFLPLSTVSAGSRLARGLLEPRRSPWPPTPRGLRHPTEVTPRLTAVPRSRPWSAPPELSLPGEPHPLSRAVAHLRVRSPTAAGAAPAGSSRSLSPVAPALRHTRPPEGRPGTHEPGRGFPAFASPVASTHRSVPHVPSPSHRHWARR
jgi:hypothetical protein